MAPAPLYLSIIFSITVILTLFFLGSTFKNARIPITILLIWLIIQSLIASTGFYTVTNTLPPRMMALLAPPILCIALLFISAKGRNYIDTLNTEWLTWLHTVRVPVEICLLLLFNAGLVPKLMTFEGINFDIISGLSAPLVVYYGYRRKTWSRNILLTWNIICLALLFNIAYHGILSVPTPFQRFGFEQPNIGLTYFPYILLPGFIVPAVLFAHLVSIRQLIRK
ncbi:MAG: hypothetical protein ACK4S0_12545 [Sediminibacterium sp.]|nr:hypothetical protein [uncultured Sediminibacterium sp.]